MIVNTLRRSCCRLLTFFRSTAAERELTREIDSHLKLLEDGFVARGLTPEEAVTKLADDRFWVNLTQEPDLSRIATAFGPAFTAVVSSAEELARALDAALSAVRSGRTAVLDVRIEPISGQPPLD